MHWLQLRVNTSAAKAADIEDAMLRNGALSVTFEDNADQPIFEPSLGETPLWSETRVTGLFDADIDTEATQKAVLRDCETTPLASQWQLLEDKDWEREWMQHFKPIDCGNNFWICPSWIEAPDKDATNLMLDPGLAFGTGTHPTTFLCLQWLASCDLSETSVVDYGCGSGILGIACLLRGASHVIGIDIDPQALIATQENVRRNSLGDEQFPVHFPDKLPHTKADYVLANILAGPLVELKPTLTSLLKDNGKICLSGILATQAEAVVQTYESEVEIENVREKDGWVCITGSKKANI